MSIVQNLPCPWCQENGHDKTGNHLMVFEDGNSLCHRSHFHTSGTKYFKDSDGKDAILDSEVTGKIKYTVKQFHDLMEAGKLETEQLRNLAYSGMRAKDKYAVANEVEKAEIKREWGFDVTHFNTLKTKALKTRFIKGEVAKFYNIRVGMSEDGKTVERHYYPRYENGEVVGAKCRTLPKEFSYGHLGKLWGDAQLFGQNTMDQVLAGGRGMETVILVGGELDAAAAQQMMTDSQIGTKWADRFWHVWSVNKGEHCIEEIVNNKTTLNRFRRIMVCFDADEAGENLAKDVGRLFRDKSLQLPLPSGCKDPCEALEKGRAAEFVQGYWNPVKIFKGGRIHTVGDLMKKAEQMPTMGLSWPWPSLDPLTFGINLNSLYVIGAGTGVGKTELTKEIVFHMIDVHGEPVGVIYLEEPPQKTVRSFAGKLINRKLENPPVVDKKDKFYTTGTDYTPEMAKDALVRLEIIGNLFIAQPDDKSIDTVMGIIEEMMAMGIRRIVVDNLTVIEVKKDGKENTTTAIDAAMKKMGGYKDEKPVSIFLISHLTRPKDPRMPHENGGEVRSNDFRGAGSINFWANLSLGLERDTMAMTDDMKRNATLRIVKCRDNGVAVGQTVKLNMSPATGRLLEPDGKVGKVYEPQDHVGDF